MYHPSSAKSLPLKMDSATKYRRLLFLKACYVALLGTYIVWKRLKRGSKRKWWVKPICRPRKLRGQFYTLFQGIRTSDPDQFFSYTRLTVSQFDKLLRLVAPLLEKRSKREAIDPEQRLAMTLKFLVHGGTLNSLAESFCIGKSTTNGIIRETCRAIVTVLNPRYLRQPLMEEWQEIANGFWDQWNMPNCIGAIDGKHVIIQCSKTRGYTNENNHSLALFAACDEKYCFTLVDVDANDLHSDRVEFSNLGIGQALESGTLQLPEASALPGTSRLFPHYFVGDSTLPLKHNLMLPYSGDFLDASMQIFNYRLSRARRIVENAFGILASRWGVYSSKIIGTPDTVEVYIKATICLHNYIMKTNSDMYVPDDYVDTDASYGQWREMIGSRNCLKPIDNLGADITQNAANDMRDCLKDYLCNEGAIDEVILLSELKLLENSQ